MADHHFFVPVQPTVFLHYKFFEDHLNITCSANARPAPVIFWKVSGSGIENSTEVLSHPNGTTSVTSILQVKDPKSQVGKEVVCQVLHLGKVTSVAQTVDKGKRRLWLPLCTRSCQVSRRASWPVSQGADGETME